MRSRLSLCFFVVLSLTAIFANGQSPSSSRPDKPKEPVVDDEGFYYPSVNVLLPRLADKGLTKEAILAKPRIKDFRLPRPAPTAEFTTVASTDQPASGFPPIKVELLEEAGTDRDAAVRFGLPFSKACVFSTDRIRVHNAEGKPVPCQCAVTEFWPDRSIRWALLQFTAPLKADERTEYTVRYDPATAAGGPTVEVSEQNDAILVDTGKLKVEIDRNRFNILKNVVVADKPVGSFSDHGLAGVLEDGQAFFSSAVKPRRISFEEKGSRVVVVRIDGSTGLDDGTPAFLDYTARFRFLAGSARVQIDLTVTNVGLDREFHDFQKLSLTFKPSGTVSEIGGGLYDAKLTTYGNKSGVSVTPWSSVVPASAVQQTDRDFRRGVWPPSPGKLSSGMLVKTDSGNLALAIRDLWKRWPKGFAATKNEIVMELLPSIPSKDFGHDLPHYLAFPFCEGCYRLKWGMSFTETVFFDFAPGDSAAAVQAEADFPVVAVVDRDWYAAGDVVPGVTSKAEKFLDGWDVLRTQGFEQHMAYKERQREYGFLNYGDWYGERGCNWGNNEYDTARSLFATFARTGRRDMQRLAVATALHQADVDIVHAYPDPYYVGGNHVHTVAHTGQYGQRPSATRPAGIRGTWSYPYSWGAAAANGHTWTGGMLDAWRYVGSARSRDASLELAEHITWAMAPTFTRLGTHERTAGWSLYAICQLFDSVNDPAYLEAARKIAGVALREQKLDKGGAWPHKLPADHAGGHEETFGNAVFIIGVLVKGLREYHQVTNDPAVAASLEGACEWIKLVRQPTHGQWPYTASWDGKVYIPGNGTGGVQQSPGLIYTARIRDRKDFYENAVEALKAAYGEQRNMGFGKTFAQTGISVCDMLQELKKWKEKTGESPDFSSPPPAQKP